MKVGGKMASIMSQVFVVQLGLMDLRALTVVADAMEEVQLDPINRMITLAQI